jgi:hypothetical protein
VTGLLQAVPEAAAVVAAIEAPELARLLGMPRDRPLEGEMAARAALAREWYARHGRPALFARRATVAGIGEGSVRLEGGRMLTGAAIARRLATGRAHAALAVAVTAGQEVDAETERLWKEDRPDEAYFLDRLATAVVERLMLRATTWLCREASIAGETALGHLSPGCGAWEFEAQRALFGWLAGDDPNPEIAPLEMLESGMLRPKLSLLAVVGLTREGAVSTAADSCRACDLARCVFRRAPYLGAAA